MQDTIWLLDKLHAFMDLVVEVLRAGRPGDAAAGGHPSGSGIFGDGGEGSRPKRSCFLAFVERANPDSKLFVRKEVAIQELLARGCEVETLIAEDTEVCGELRPGRVLRVTLADAGRA
ncbi:hypothetical protein GPECTOR_2g1447 [Gonium pectorale]|uniref:Uncharacterized protein n=1 Tax=Gonium pectorale TaxID=33097 RepID=A0A150H149_GONPE|nr:hypothetical protein GPECTOR_2g1447 [Gonium pectorale]|eukprot:KXZ55896.1 hypothetical protein GPECTOR_2g1447 [Gonium pectorale]